MKISDAIRYAFGHLRRHPLRTGLTACGVGIGVGTLTLLVSLGQGLQELVEAQFMKAELIARIHVMREGTKDQLFRGALSKKNQAGAPITSQVVADLAKLPGVTAAWPLLQPIVVAESEGSLLPTQCEGLPASALGENHKESLVAGRYWTEDEGDVCVLPSGLLEDLGIERAEDALGARVHLSGLDALRRYRQVEVPGTDPPRYRFERPEGLDTIEVEVIGVFSSKEFGQFGHNIQLPAALAEKLLKKSPFGQPPSGDGSYPAAVVRVSSPEAIDAVAAEIEKKGFDALTVYDVLLPIRIVFTVFKVLLGMFGSIGLIVALFGIANTMVMAVLERTREIGVLKALGARNRDIRRTFLAEAGAIGGMGAAGGIAGAWAFGQVLNLIANSLLKDQVEAGTWLAFFHIPATYGLSILFMSIFVAAAAGLWPAVRAARLDPVVALRLE